jgi:hypothetical protein
METLAPADAVGEVVTGTPAVASWSAEPPEHAASASTLAIRQPVVEIVLIIEPPNIDTAVRPPRAQTITSSR